LQFTGEIADESDELCDKFDRGLTDICRNDLHWFDVPERVTFNSES